MSENVQNLIDELIDAVAAEDEEQINQLSKTLATEYDTVRRDQQKLINKASIARRNQTLSTADRETLASFLQTASDTGMKRGAFMLQLSAAVAAIERGNSPDEALTSTATELKSTEATLEQQTADVEPVVTSASLDPSVEILTAIATSTDIETGESTSITVSYANVGDESATDVEIAIEPTGGLAMDSTSDYIGTLSADQEGERTYECTGTARGDQSITITINSANGGSDVNDIDITVTGDESGRSVSDYENEAGVVDTPGLRDAIEDWRADEIDTNLLRNVIDAWRNN